MIANAYRNRLAGSRSKLSPEVAGIGSVNVFKSSVSEMLMRGLQIRPSDIMK